jgi:uncharacterized integral membrane protein
MSKKGWVKLIVLLVVVVLLLIITFQNRRQMVFEVLFWTFGFSAPLLLIAMFLVGFLAGRFSIPYIGRRKG